MWWKDGSGGGGANQHLNTIFSMIFDVFPYTFQILVSPLHSHFDLLQLPSHWLKNLIKIRLPPPTRVVSSYTTFRLHPTHSDSYISDGLVKGVQNILRLLCLSPPTVSLKPHIVGWVCKPKGFAHSHAIPYEWDIPLSQATSDACGWIFLPSPATSDWSKFQTHIIHTHQIWEGGFFIYG